MLRAARCTPLGASRLVLWAALTTACGGAAGVIDPSDLADTRTAGGVCLPGAAVCNASYLLTCRADGAGYTELFCEKGCREGTCVSSACVDGSTQCSGGKLLETCADGAWRTTLCDQACANGACVPVSCAAGQIFCEPGGSKRVQCSATGLELTVLETCAFGCDATTATCKTAACTPGQRRCSDDGTPQRCNAAQTGFEPSAPACDERCEGGECVVSACSPGDKRCGADGVETCNAGGTGFQKSQACTYGCLDGPDGAAQCATCFPGVTRCDDQDIQFCASPFQPWQTVETCHELDTCAGGQCVNLLTLTGEAGEDSVRLKVMEALADCWVELETKSAQETGDRYICRGVDTTEMQGDLAQDDLAGWFCDAAGEGLTADDFKDETHYEAAQDVMGCGTLDFLDLTIDTLNHKLHAGLYAEECIAFDRSDAEILVAPCASLKTTP